MMEEQINNLEQRELETGPDGIGIEGYTELLAYYLLQDELCNAKFLWKRVPQTMKQQSPEFEAVWTVGKRLWGKDMAGFYQAVGAFQWTQQISPIIAKLTESVREKTIRLIGTAYSSIRPGDVATLLGLSLPDVEQLVIGGRLSGWRIQDGMVEPTEILEDGGAGGKGGRGGIGICGEEQIAKLTDYVAFLEN